MLRLLRIPFLAAFALLTAAVTAPAQYTWNNFTGTTAATTLWSTPANWTPGVAVSAPTTTVTFGSDLSQTSGSYLSTYDSAFTLISLVLASAGAPNSAVSITGNAAGNTLNFTANGLTNPSIVQNGTGTAVFSIGGGAGLSIAGGAQLQFLGSGIGNVTLNVPIVGGAGSILVNQTGVGIFVGSGSLLQSLGAATAFSGGLTITSGNLAVSASHQLGTGTVTVNGNNQSLRLTLNSGTFSNNFNLVNTLNITPIVAATTLSGQFTGAGGLNVRNAVTSTLTFTVTNAFTGTAVVNPVGANTGTLALSGNGTFAGTTGVTIYSTGSLTLDDSTTTVANRVNPAATLTLHRANLSVTAGATGTNSQRSPPWPAAAKRCW